MPVKEDYLDVNDYKLFDDSANIMSYGGKKFKLYMIPDIAIPVRATEIKLIYKCTGKVSQEVTANILTDLKGSYKEHQISEHWGQDSECHWHYCVENGCDYVEDKAEHDGEWKIIIVPTEEKDGLKQRICKVCGYVSNETVPKGHIHQLGGWKNDGEMHWKECDDPLCPLTINGVKAHIGEAEHDLRISNIYAATDDNHTVKCNKCDMPDTQKPHTWDDGKDDGDYIIYTCTFKDCNRTKRVEKPNLEKAKNVGLYTKLLNVSDVYYQPESAICYMLAPDGTIKEIRGQNYDPNGNNMKFSNEIGVIMREDYINIPQTTIWVNGNRVENNELTKLTEDLWIFGDYYSMYGLYGNSELPIFKIPSKYYGDGNTAKVEVKFNDTTLISREIRFKD